VDKDAVKSAVLVDMRNDNSDVRNPKLCYEDMQYKQRFLQQGPTNTGQLSKSILESLYLGELLEVDSQIQCEAWNPIQFCTNATRPKNHLVETVRRNACQELDDRNSGVN
jgi:hypothetical protein